LADFYLGHMEAFEMEKMVKTVITPQIIQTWSEIGFA
jgi:hypothetical protein